MPTSNTRLVLRGLSCAVIGAIIGGGLCVLGYLPSLMVATPGSDPPDTNRLVIGVALVGARAGAVLGIIYFLVKRSLTGEVPDPRIAPPPKG